MITRPSFISISDWNELTKKYTSDEELSNIINKLENNYPIQYAIGNVEFLDTKILVDERVLIPRFETELLVSKLIKYIYDYNLNNSNMLDLCCGSGCIGINLKHNFDNAYVTCVDKSNDALNLARENAKLNECNIDFLNKDVLNEYNYNEKYSIIVSNPPYVRLDEYVSENTKYEPSMALYPGEDDILFYKRILDYSKDIITNKNIIAFEIGSTQAERIVQYAKNMYPNARIEVQKDYNDFDRYIFIFNNCE